MDSQIGEKDTVYGVCDSVCELKDKYLMLNNSFEKSLVYHVGIDAGFFSEYGDMVDMMFYSLSNKISFKLYSADSNFGYEKGWSDYFEPFCEETYKNIHHFANVHQKISWKQIVSQVRKDILPLLKYKIKLDLFSPIGSFYKWQYGYSYYTQDLSKKVLNRNKLYSLPSLGLWGDYQDMYQLMDAIIWHFNPDTRKKIGEHIFSLDLPREYISCQIRGGDKVMEYGKLYSADMYLKRIQELSSIKDVFVLTDDYGIILELREKAPDFNWYSFCTPEEKGYFNSDFTLKEPYEKRKQMIRFFASIELLKESKLFLGTITSGPSCHIANLNQNEVFFVDMDTDKYLYTIDTKYGERQNLIRDFLTRNAKAGIWEQMEK